MLNVNVKSVWNQYTFCVMGSSLSIGIKVIYHNLMYAKVYTCLTCKERKYCLVSLDYNENHYFTQISRVVFRWHRKVFFAIVLYILPYPPIIIQLSIKYADICVSVPHKFAFYSYAYIKYSWVQAIVHAINTTWHSIK